VELSKQNKSLIEDNRVLNREKLEMQVQINEIQNERGVDAEKYHEVIYKLEEQLQQEIERAEELSKLNEALSSYFRNSNG
jgi:hypothetical protein